MRTVLVFILLLAGILRFWNLWSVPPSASLDEASIGYNAYSILKTGGDEYGEFPILSHRSYDDYRRAIYLYLVVPFVALLGLDVISVRLPAGILSMLTIWATYFLTKELFTINPKSEARNLKQIQNQNNQNSKNSLEIRDLKLDIPIIATAMLAISPWHIYISRLGHESNAGLSFLVFGILIFLKGKSKNSWILILLSMLFFTLSMVSYYSGQVFIPLFVIGLLILFRKDILSIILTSKKMIVAFLIFLILLVPIFLEIFSPRSLIRFEGTSTFKPEAHLEMYRERLDLWNKAIESNNIVGSVLYSRYLFPVQVFVEGYISHFKPEWLFANPGDQSHKVPNIGLLYLWEIPFLIIGIFTLFFSHIIGIKIKWLVFLWFFLAPIPAALATQTPHAMRSYNFLPTWQIFTALGLAYVYYRFKLQKFNILVLFTIFFIILVSLTRFYKNYFMVFPKTQSKSFQYALKDAILYTKIHEEEYEKIVFSNKDNLYQSYMFYLFHARYDPAVYQKQGGTISGGFNEAHKFGKFEFRPIVWEQEAQRKNNSLKILYIGNRGEIPEDITTIAVFKNLDESKTIIAAIQ